MNKCAHPQSTLGFCARSAPCLGVCEWAASQLPAERIDGADAPHKYNNLESWTNEEQTPETLISPCGRFEITRIRITVLARRYSAWDKYPTDGDGLPALAGVFDSAKAALRCINEISKVPSP